MNALDQRLAAWSGLVFTVLFGMGLAIAGWLPLPSPNMTAEQVAEMYRSHTNGIRAGMVLMVFGGVFFLAMTAATTVQMKRIQGCGVAPYLQLATGIVNMSTFLFGPLIMGIAAFRPERDADVLYALHDLGWLIFIMPFPPASFQCFSIALGVFRDRNAFRIFPRWFGYMNVWAGLLYMPGALTFFFKAGPFAWNGLLTFYIAATAFFAWIVTLVFLLLKAIRREEEESRSVAVQ
jgi:hypothetical protein